MSFTKLNILSEIIVHKYLNNQMGNDIGLSGESSRCSKLLNILLPFQPVIILAGDTRLRNLMS